MDLAAYKEDSLNRACPLSRSICDNKKITSATLCITAHGLYEVMINHKRVGETYFTPGWTS